MQFYIVECGLLVSLTSFMDGGDIYMSNDILMLLFNGGLFLIALIDLIVLLIDKISKK